MLAKDRKTTLKSYGPRCVFRLVFYAPPGAPFHPAQNENDVCIAIVRPVPLVKLMMKYRTRRHRTRRVRFTVLHMFVGTALFDQNSSHMSVQNAFLCVKTCDPLCSPHMSAS